MRNSASVNTLNKRRQIIANLRNKEDRAAIVEEHIAVGIPIQIRALREREGWSQKRLGQISNQKQSRISLLEKVGYEGYTVKTLTKIAAAFDVALIVTFAPFSELVDRMTYLSTEDVLVDRYKDDKALKAPRPRKKKGSNLYLAYSADAASPAPIDDNTVTVREFGPEATDTDIHNDYGTRNEYRQNGSI